MQHKCALLCGSAYLELEGQRGSIQRQYIVDPGVRPTLDEVETTEHLSSQQSASDRLCATSELAEQIKFLRASGCLDATPPTCEYYRYHISGPLQSPVPTPEWGPGTKLRGDGGGGGGDGRVRVWEVRQW